MFHDELYEQLLMLPFEAADADVQLALDCLRMLLLKRREVSSDRVAALTKRMLVVATSLPAHLGLALFSMASTVIKVGLASSLKPTWAALIDHGSCIPLPHSAIQRYSACWTAMCWPWACTCRLPPRRSTPTPLPPRCGRCRCCAVTTSPLWASSSSISWKASRKGEEMGGGEYLPNANCLVVNVSPKLQGRAQATARDAALDTG